MADNVAGEVVVQVRAELTTYNRNMDAAEAKAKKFDQASTASITRAANNARQQLSGVTAAVNTTSTSLTGLDSVLVGVAASLGTMFGNAVGAAVRATIQAVAQFGELRNELAQVPALMGASAQAMQLVVITARQGNRSLADVANQYANLSQEVVRYGGSQQRVNEIFADWNRTLALTQIPTVAGSFSRFGAAFGGFVSGLDNATGVSSLFTTVLNKISRGFEYLADKLPAAQTGLDRLRRAAADTQKELDDLNRTGRTAIQSIDGEVRTRSQLVEILRQQRSEINLIEQGLKRTPEDLARAEQMIVRITEQLNQRIAMPGISPIRERISQEFQELSAELSRAQGVVSLDLLTALRERITLANLVPELNTFRQSLQTTAQAENESYVQRLDLARQFYDARLVTETEYNNLIQQQFFAHTIAMQQAAQNSAQMQLQATASAVQESVSLLGVFANKSKAAAIAAVALNKGLAIAQAIQNTAVAATRALAELGPIAGPPMAASIKAWGAIQVGLIAATGIAQAAGAGGGGSAPTAGARSNFDTPNISQVDDGSQSSGSTVFIEGIDPAMMYSGDQLEQLVGRINDAVKNGATLVATKNVSF